MGTFNMKNRTSWTRHFVLALSLAFLSSACDGFSLREIPSTDSSSSVTPAPSPYLKGLIDTTFPQNNLDLGGTDEYATAIDIQADGKVVVGGYTDFNGNDTDFLIMRLNMNGTLDTTFAGVGYKLIDGGGNETLKGIKVKPNGKIIAVGSSDLAGDIFVAQLLPNGNLDTTFNPTGSTPGTLMLDLGGTDEEAGGVDVLANNSAILAGHSDVSGVVRAQVISLLDDGTLNPAFGAGASGIEALNFGETDDTANALKIQTNGSIVVVGSSHGAATRAAIARLQSDGSVDATFGGGTKIFSIGGIANQLSAVTVSGTDIYACGASRTGAATFHSSILKVSANGSLDTTFNTTGFLIDSISTTVDRCSSIQLDTASNIITVGEAIVDPTLYTYNSFFRQFENLFFALTNLIVPAAKAFTVTPTDLYVASHLQDGTLADPFGAVNFHGIFVRDLSGGLMPNEGDAAVFDSSGKLYVTGSLLNGSDEDIGTILLK